MSEQRYQKIELLGDLERKLDKVKSNRLDLFFSHSGPYRRSLYKKHLFFFESGTKYRERAMIAANRVGKTIAAAYELTLHLTGEYPNWWNGRKFDRGVSVWAAGQTSKTVRDIIQLVLTGRRGEEGTGMIPADKIKRITSKQGIADAIEDIYVKHTSGIDSICSFKSYDQGQESFMGTEKDVIWLDEEPNISIYSECLTRTMTVNGMILCTFTPLNGLSDVVLSFMPHGRIPKKQESNKYIIQVTWDDVPHLPQDIKEQLWSELPPHERDARSKGIPQLGSGAIYPLAEEEIIIKPFEIPSFWEKSFGLDVGYKKTAAIWSAWHRSADVVYIYDEYYRGEAETSIHADAILARGNWIPGVIDPASRGRSQHDGTRIIDIYRQRGVNLDLADNAVNAGIMKVWQRLSSGRLKIFSNCQNWRDEFRVYRRDRNGNIVKEKDHLMDATRYNIMSGLSRAIRETYGEEEQLYEKYDVNPVTGY